MINLNVNHTMIKASNLGTLVEGNVNSIPVSFTFSDEWNGLTRLAVFSSGGNAVAVTLFSGTCMIPHEALTADELLYVSVRGVGDGGSCVLCTENEFLGRVAKSLANGELVDASEATPDVLDTLLADVAELKENGGGGSGADGKSAYEIAAENGFEGTEQQWLASLKGADGIDGTDGADGSDGYTPVKGTDYFTVDDKAELVSEILSNFVDVSEVGA